MNQAEYKVKISSVAEVRALREMEASLQKQIVQARVLGKEYGDLEKQLGAVQGQLGKFGLGQKLGAEVLGFAEKIPVLGEGMRALNGAVGAMSGYAAGAAVALAAAAKSVNEFAQAEQVVTRLDAALAQFGLLTESNRAQFQALAGELQNATGIADERWLGVLAKLVQFGSNPDTVGMDAEAVKNLAGIVGDIETAVGLYTKALAGNFEMMGRYGIKVDEAATKTEKLAQLQEIAAQRGGGQLEAQTKTLSGRFETLKNNISDAWEGLGAWISRTGVLQSVLGFASTMIGSFAESISSTVPAVDGLENKLENLGTTLGDVEQANKDFATSQKQIKDASDANTKALDKELQAIQKRQRELDQMYDAEMAEKLAMLDLEKAQRGPKMSEVEYTKREAEIRKDFADKKFANDQLAKDESIAKIKKSLAAPAQAADQAAAAVRAQEVVLAGARAQQKILEIQQQIAATEKAAATAPQFPAFMEGNDPGTVGDAFAAQVAAASEAKSKLPGLQQALAEAQKAFEPFRAKLPNLPRSVSVEESEMKGRVETKKAAEAAFASELKAAREKIAELEAEKAQGSAIHKRQSSTSTFKTETDLINADKKDAAEKAKEDKKAATEADKNIMRDFKTNDAHGSVNINDPTSNYDKVAEEFQHYHRQVLAGLEVLSAEIRQSKQQIADNYSKARGWDV